MSRRYPEGSGGWGAGVPFLPSHYRHGIDNWHDTSRFGPIPGLKQTLEEAPDGSLVHGWKRGTWKHHPPLGDNMGSGDNLSPPEFEQRISDVAAASDVGAPGGGAVVAFDLFSSQQPDEQSTSRVKLREVGGRWEVEDFTVQLPEIDLSSRDVSGTMNQLGNYLEQGPTLPINNGIYSSHATIFQDTPYFVREKRRDGNWQLNTCISGACRHVHRGDRRHLRQRVDCRHAGSVFRRDFRPRNVLPRFKQELSTTMTLTTDTTADESGGTA